MKCPKKFNKGMLVEAADEINAVSDTKLKIKSATTQNQVDRIAGVIASLSQDVVKGLSIATLETLTAFGIISKFIHEDDYSKLLKNALKSNDSDTFSPTGTDGPREMITYSKKELKKMAKAKKKEEKAAAKKAKEEAKSGKNKESKKGGDKKKPGKKGPGVIMAIKDILLAASKPGLSVDDVADSLADMFPEKERDTMIKTVRAQIGGKSEPLRLEKEKGEKFGFTIKVKGEGKDRTYLAKKA